MSPAGGDSGPIVVTGTINGGPAFFGPTTLVTSGVGGTCPGAGGFSLDATRTKFTCNVDVLTTSSGTISFDLPIVAPMSTPHGNTFTLSATISEGGNQLPNEVTATSAPTKVSAGPRFELVKRAIGSGGTANGPTGSSGAGVVQRWAIGVAALATEPYGLSQLPDPIVLNDLVGSTPASGVWLRSCNAVTGTNLVSWPVQVAIPPPSASEVVAPIPNCTQATVNGPISVSLAGIDYSRLTTPPTPGLLGYFELDTWVSNTDIEAAPSGTVHVCNAVETTTAGHDGGSGWVPNMGDQATWHPVDVSGNSNLLGDSEPIANNGACLAVTKPPPPGASHAWADKQPLIPSLNGDGVAKTSMTKSRLWYYNQGNSALTVPNGYICDKWDDSRFAPTQLTPLVFPAWATQVKVEWGLGTWGTGATDPDPQEWYRQATNDCSNNAMFTQSATVPLSSLSSLAPPSGVNAVRITFLDPLPASQVVLVDVTWAMASSVVPGDELRNYAAASFPDRPLIRTSDCPGGSPTTMQCDHLVRGQSAGTWSHWWTTIAGSVEVVKSRPDMFAYAPGGTVPWSISARGIAPVSGATGSTTDVKIVDTLPPGFTYVPGSTVGVPEPTCAGTTPQVCTWDLGNLPWSATPTVTFTFNTAISVFEVSGTYTNTARGQTPDDPAPYGPESADKRVSTKNVEVLRALGAAIDKSVAPASPTAGGTVVYTLRYGNPSSTDVTSMDAIDILPFAGDPRGSQFGAGSFTLTGITASSKVPPEEIWVTNADPTTLDALDGTDGFLDPATSGVDPVPSAQWPCKVSATNVLTNASGGACPFSLAQVTAVRFIGRATVTQAFLPAGSGPHAITLTYKLGTCITGNTFANSWLAHFSELLPIHFPAQAATASGCPPIENTTTTTTPTTTTTTTLKRPAPPAEGGQPGGGGAQNGPPGPPGSRHSIAGIALTGTDITRMSLLALVAFTLGLLMVSSTKRRERRVAFVRWVEDASVDDLLSFAQRNSAN